MIIRFTKPELAESSSADVPTASPTFTCLRDDGSTTWMRSTPFFVRHDLTHYAVETTLGESRAFYGLIRSGWDLDAFSERAPGSAKVREVPPEAIIVERIVGAFDLESSQPELLSDEDALDLILAAFQNTAPPPPPLDAAFVAEVRAARADLLSRWRAVPPGQSLELVFPKN